MAEKYTNSLYKLKHPLAIFPFANLFGKKQSCLQLIVRKVPIRMKRHLSNERKNHRSHSEVISIILKTQLVSLLTTSFAFIYTNLFFFYFTNYSRTVHHSSKLRHFWDSKLWPTLAWLLLGWTVICNIHYRR